MTQNIKSLAAAVNSTLKINNETAKPWNCQVGDLVAFTEKKGGKLLSGLVMERDRTHVHLMVNTRTMQGIIRFPLIAVKHIIKLNTAKHGQALVKKFNRPEEKVVETSVKKDSSRGMYNLDAVREQLKKAEENKQKKEEVKGRKAALKAELKAIKAAKKAKVKANAKNGGGSFRKGQKQR